ncbi:hypothetical protein O181_023700 [Austropuccinia psidii MF-1]|uniref:Uncharacterized protein n=1 Tax=Austropuccinia psidii MF-1 TaxID=1389203 RepID=A0A9Q3GZC4_9BASI|nr:hypothetical protein [Austropuccinia psidii MF-1]
MTHGKTVRIRRVFSFWKKTVERHATDGRTTMSGLAWLGSATAEHLAAGAVRMCDCVQQYCKLPAISTLVQSVPYNFPCTDKKHPHGICFQIIDSETRKVQGGTELGGRMYSCKNPNKACCSFRKDQPTTVTTEDYYSSCVPA